MPGEVNDVGASSALSDVYPALVCLRLWCVSFSGCRKRVRRRPGPYRGPSASSRQPPGPLPSLHPVAAQLSTRQLARLCSALMQACPHVSLILFAALQVLAANSPYDLLRNTPRIVEWTRVRSPESAYWSPGGARGRHTSKQDTDNILRPHTHQTRHTKSGDPCFISGVWRVAELRLAASALG